ncbi:MAG TPA: DUF4405 domain-containing protein [Methanofastidiosum sp.]|nr:DUF4405 domain-containing protein [Methanofastidiosum sp.]HNU62058.1 DUF4405 domain-containing protein [Methanofastidiosum sp.]
MKRADTNYIVDVLMTLSLIVVGVTGIILFFFFESGIRQGGYQTFFGVTKSSWNFFHEYIGLLMVFLMVLHFLLHWNWMVCMTKKLLSKKPSKCEIE